MDNQSDFNKDIGWPRSNGPCFFLGQWQSKNVKFLVIQIWNSCHIYIYIYEVGKTSDSTLQQHLKMASVTDVHWVQHAVMEFHVSEKKLLGKIHKNLCSVHGSATVDRSTVGAWARRVTAFETWKTELHALPCSVHPVTAVKPKMLSVLMLSCTRIDIQDLAEIVN